MERIGFKTEFVPSEPQRVYIELTSRCNLNCSICYRRSWELDTGDIDAEILEDLVLQLKGFATQPEVVLGGIGEPTWYPGFIEVLESLQGLPVTLTSNGVLLNEEDIAKAVAGSVSKLVISVDGCDETYYKIRGTSLKAVIKGIERVKSFGKGPEILLQFVLSAENQDSIWSVIDLAADLNLQGVIVSNLLPQTEAYKHQILYSESENPDMRQFFNRVRNYSLTRGIYVNLPGYQLRTDRRCRFIDNGGVVINSHGEVSPCYRLAHPGREYVFGRRKEVVCHSFGNLAEVKLLDIWNQRAYQSFRHTVYCNLYPSCVDCELVDGCGIVSTTTWDCEGNMPTCGDCLWARNFVICP